MGIGPGRLTPLVASSLAIAAFAVSACGSSNKSSSGASASSSTSASGSGSSGSKACVPKKTLGLVDLIQQSPIDNKTDQMAILAAKRLGWQVKFVDAGGDPAKANTAVNNFVTQKVDLIIATSLDAAPIRSGLKAAQRAKIPVFEVAAGNQPSDLYTGMYNEDETTMGKILAQYIVKNVKNAKIGDLSTNLNYAGVLRENALQQVVKSSPGAQVVADTQVDLSDPVTNTTKAVTAQLTAHPDINAFYAVFDNMAAAAVAAVRSKGKAGQAGIYTYFTTPANVQALKAGKLAALADANLPAGSAVAIDQYLANTIKKQPIDKNALKSSGLLDYKVVDKKNLPSSGEVFDNNKTLDKFMAQWQQKYPC